MISNLNLTNFRNYSSLQLAVTKMFVVLHGQNGSGKTNILEAISLFTPGKSLRKATVVEMQGLNSEVKWVVTGVFARYFLACTVKGSRRHFFLNREPLLKSSHLTDIIRIFWVTPEIDRLFLTPQVTQKQFIDRMAYVLWPEHLITLRKYEHYTKERLKILNLSINDVWLTNIENELAKIAIELAERRSSLLHILNTNQECLKNFPSFAASMDGEFENWISTNSLDRLATAWKNTRLKDSKVHMTTFGPHRSEFKVLHKIKHMVAEQCSTGEQKILLLSLILTFVSYLLKNLNCTFLLLLDEIVSHLDSINSEMLFATLWEMAAESNKLQVWMTGTQALTFANIKDKADFINIGG